MADVLGDRRRQRDLHPQPLLSRLGCRSCLRRASVSTPLSAAASATSAVTTHCASFSDGIIAAPSSMSARTGVMPVVPMISAEVIRAPSQCDTSMIF